MNFSQWVDSVPESITDDSLWKMKVYQLALFASDIGWHDVLILARDKRTISLADQLYRALGSIGANIAEGYSYGTGTNRARFYEYALGSARESRHWYYEARFVLNEHVTEHRLNLMASVARQLLAIIPQQRGRSLREKAVQYEARSDEIHHGNTISVDIDSLLLETPFMRETTPANQD